VVQLNRHKKPKCGVHYCDKNNHKTAESCEISQGKRALSFLFEEINALKKQLQPAKAENPKKRKAEFLLSSFNGD
jgi:hypothetical protein